MCRTSGCTVASGVVVVVVVGGGVCNRSQMRTSKYTCLVFGASLGLHPGKKCTKVIFDRSKFKVTRDISPTIADPLWVASISLSVTLVLCVFLSHFALCVWLLSVCLQLSLFYGFLT